MTVKKRSKNSRQRGSKTHGWGSMKKHRGAGHRGGRGRAGQGKRGTQRMSEGLGKKGFVKQGVKKNIKRINLDDLNRLIESGKIKEGMVDLSQLGYNKLLGSGKIKAKLQIKVDCFSKKAEEKIKEAGGEILKFEAEKGGASGESEGKKE